MKNYFLNALKNGDINIFSSQIKQLRFQPGLKKARKASQFSKR